MTEETKNQRYRKLLLGVLVIDVLIAVGGLLLCLAVHAHVPLPISILVGLWGAASAAAFWATLTNADRRSPVRRLAIAAIGGALSLVLLAHSFLNAVLA